MTSPQLALSIRQPWAWLIAHGYKDVENRTWLTKFRGPFLIHAGLRLDRGAYDELRFTRSDIPLPRQFELGGIVGHATLTDCVQRMDSEWFTGPHGFVVRDASPLPFRPCRGRLGFFTPAPVGEEVAS